MNDDDKNCNDFFTVLGGGLALIALIVHPFLTIGVLILWAVGAARQPKTPKRRSNADIYAAIDAAHQRAVARERLPLWARIEELRRDELGQDAEQHRQWTENKQKVWARAVEAEAKLKQYAP